MRVHVAEQSVDGEMIDYDGLYQQGRADVLSTCRQVLDGDTGEWEGRSLSGKEGCSVLVDAGAIIVIEGSKKGEDNAWLIVIEGDEEIARLVVDEHAHTRKPVELPNPPQEALSDMKRILDVLYGMQHEEGTLQDSFS